MKRFVVGLLLLLLIGTTTACKSKNAQTDSLFDTIDANYTAEEALSLVKGSSVVVFEGMKCTSGDELWKDFYKRVTRGKSASIICAYYYELDKDHMSKELYEAEKDQYPKLFLSLLEYDGDKYTVSDRLSTEKELDSQEEFKYLMKYTGSAPEQANFSSYEYYVLVDDNTVTWNGIWAGMISSQANAGIKHHKVYTNIFD